MKTNKKLGGIYALAFVGGLLAVWCLAGTPLPVGYTLGVDTNNVLTLATNLYLKGDRSSLIPNPDRSQLQIMGLSDPKQRLELGYDTVGDFAVIQADYAGVALRPLYLNPQGGTVQVGTTNNASPSLVASCAAAGGSVQPLAIINQSGMAHYYGTNGVGALTNLSPASGLTFSTHSNLLSGSIEAINDVDATSTLQLTTLQSNAVLRLGWMADRAGASVYIPSNGLVCVPMLNQGFGLTLSNLDLYTGDPNTGLAPGSNPAAADNVVVIDAPGHLQIYFPCNVPGYEGWYRGDFTPASDFVIPELDLTNYFGGVPYFYVKRKAPNPGFTWHFPTNAPPWIGLSLKGQANFLRIENPRPPLSAADLGRPGMFSWATNGTLFLCVATNTWQQFCAVPFGTAPISSTQQIANPNGTTNLVVFTGGQLVSNIANYHN